MIQNSNVYRKLSSRYCQLGFFQCDPAITVTFHLGEQRGRTESGGAHSTDISVERTKPLRPQLLDGVIFHTFPVCGVETARLCSQFSYADGDVTSTINRCKRAVIFQIVLGQPALLPQWQWPSRSTYLPDTWLEDMILCDGQSRETALLEKGITMTETLFCLICIQRSPTVQLLVLSTIFTLNGDTLANLMRLNDSRDTFIYYAEPYKQVMRHRFSIFFLKKKELCDTAEFSREVDVKIKLQALQDILLGTFYFYEKSPCKCSRSLPNQLPLIRPEIAVAARRIPSGRVCSRWLSRRSSIGAK